MANKLDMKALAKQQAERRAGLKATEAVIKSDSGDAPVVPVRKSSAGRKAKYTQDNPRHNMTLALTEDAWTKIKIVAVKRKTTPSAMIMEFIESLDE